LDVVRRALYNRGMANTTLAIFSDIHSNLEAFQAVLADMKSLGVKPFLCLGDIVGYCANPVQCLKRVRSLGCRVLQGNHDWMTAGDTDLSTVSDTARHGIDFCRRQLSTEERGYLASLPLTGAEGDCEFVHASLEAPADWWYVIDKMDALAHFHYQTQPLCFCGHTHVPFIWHFSKTGTIKGRPGDGRIELPSTGKVLINVGSVGQPRDFRPEACYVICNPAERWVEFRRVPYDLEKAQRKIRRAKLPRFAADRLAIGR